MNKVELKVQERESFGSPEARRLRKTGMVPGVLYGSGQDSTPLSVDEKALRKALGREPGSVVLALVFEGQKKEHPAVLKEYQTDPRTSSLLHVDFMEIRMDQPVEAHIRIELGGAAAGVREGGVMDQGLRELHIRCLPTDIPELIEHDVEELAIGDTLRVADIKVPAGVEILDDPETPVASVHPPTVIREEEEIAAEEGAAEGEAAAGAEAEGEAAAEEAGE